MDANNWDFSKYLEVFNEWVKVFVTESHKRDDTLLAPLVPRNLKVKISTNLELDKMRVVAAKKAEEHKYWSVVRNASHQQYLVFNGKSWLQVQGTLYQFRG